MDFILGIDIGTTHSKGIVADHTGKIRWSTKTAYGFKQPHEGYHEQDADEILGAVRAIIGDASTRYPSITCISFSSAMHSVVLVDASGKAISPMMTWADTRSTRIAAALKASPEGQSIYEATGTPVHPMSPLCKIAWLKQNDIDLFNRAARFVSIKEYAWFHLTGEWCIDESVASATGLFNIHLRTWNAESLAFASIGAERLSVPVPVTHMFSAAAMTYVIGASDGALANLGTGAIHDGQAALTIGTSGAVRVFNRKPINDRRQRLFNYVVDDEYYLTGGAINNGGITLNWFIDTFYGQDEEKDLGNLVSRAETISPGCNGLIFLPYIYGERAPVWDAECQGVFFGIRSLHTRDHFLRAVLEGICFSLKQILEAIEEADEPVDVISASGGFTASPTWLQIMADILGKEIRLTQDADASGIGAVYLALKALGHINSWEELVKLREAPEGTSISPDPDRTAAYTTNYGVFSRLYYNLKDEFHTS